MWIVSSYNNWIFIFVHFVMQVKQSKATNVVYAELVVLENTHDTMGTRQNTNYAEITRLAQSPRNMTPVED